MRISSASANDYLTTYSWDYRDRLTDVYFYNNSSVLTSHVHYIYDVLNHRISKSIDSTGSGSYDRIEDYVYDGNEVVLDFADPDGAGPQSVALATRYLNGPGNTLVTDQVFAQENASTGDVLWLLSDNLGTTRDVVDDSSTLQAHFVYNSFGQLASGPTNLTRFLYTGEEWDADVGLQYNWHRWYDPAVGRWISEDPIGFEGHDANVSRYVGNAVTDQRDPSGLSWLPPGVNLTPTSQQLLQQMQQMQQLQNTLIAQQMLQAAMQMALQYGPANVPMPPMALNPPTQQQLLTMQSLVLNYMSQMNLQQMSAVLNNMQPAYIQVMAQPALNAQQIYQMQIMQAAYNAMQLAIEILLEQVLKPPIVIVVP